MKDKISVLVFDSGVGGFSIYDQVRKLLGEEVNLHYFSDQEFFPYGTKTESLVIDRVIKVATNEEIIRNYDIFVVACNTASTVALRELRDVTSKPVVGVVPAIKPAAALTKSKLITLLATPATIARPYTMELIESFAPDCQVLRIGSQKLVELAEQRLLMGDRSLSQDFFESIREEISACFHRIDQRRTDVIVLGCTHFPLLVDLFEKFSPWEVRFLDSGSAVSSRVRHLVDEIAGEKYKQDKISSESGSVVDSTLYLSGYGSYGETNWRQMQNRFSFANFRRISF